MARGGKREGSGRKTEGITKKVSLTLTKEEWAMIEASDQPTVASFLKSLMQKKKKQDMKEENKVAQPEPTASAAQQQAMTHRDFDWQWRNYIEDHRNEDIERIKRAQERMRELLFKKQDVAVVETKTQFICPFTNKRFGSMEKLVKANIPRMIEWEKFQEKKRKEKEQEAFLKQHESTFKEQLKR